MIVYKITASMESIWCEELGTFRVERVQIGPENFIKIFGEITGLKIHPNINCILNCNMLGRLQHEGDIGKQSV